MHRESIEILLMAGTETNPPYVTMRLAAGTKTNPPYVMD